MPSPRITIPLALACFVAAAAGPAHATEPARYEIERIAGPLARLSGTAAGGVLVLEGADGLLLVDSEDPKNAAAFDSALAGLSPRPVRFIVNTHYHEDHLGGNARWRAKGAVLIGHRNLAAQARKDTVIAALGDWHRTPPPAAALPLVTFDDSLRLWIDGREVEVFHAPAAHSDGDAMLWFPGLDVVHTGDVVEVGAPPFIDWWAGGTLAGMVAAVDRVLALAGPRTRIVPGHGAVVDRAWIEEYRRMLVATGERARAALREGMDGRAFAATDPAREWQDRLGGESGARQFSSLVLHGLREFGR
jgi:glyoxylase-like metal-dependent hydrolase (beta-lactamase superfamily II)